MESRGSDGRSARIFALSFLRHPLLLGTPFPSSRWLVRRLLEPFDAKKARVVVEYGPGTGVVTEELLRRMPEDGRLVAIEKNPVFVEALRAMLPDPRLEVVEGSAEDVGSALAQHGLTQADYVVSGIPFSLIPAGQRREVLRATRQALKQEGMFLVYQYRTGVRRELEAWFPRVEKAFEPRNVLPAHLFYCMGDHGRSADVDVRGAQAGAAGWRTSTQ